MKHDVANNTKNIATNTQNIANNTKAINTLNKKVHDVDRRRYCWRCSNFLLHLLVKMVSTGVLNRGESAIAIKASRNSDNGHWSSNVNGAADTRSMDCNGYEW